MKLLRYQDSHGKLHYGSLSTDGTTHRLNGDPISGWSTTQEVADVSKILAPIEPRDILCFGLYFLKHAAEGGQPIA